MSHGGKGYVQRPIVVDEEVMESNWERIFGNRNRRGACGQETCAKKKGQCKKDSACPGKEETSSQEDD